MTIDRFKQLPISHQHKEVKQQGTLLGRRESKRFSIYLFAVYSFYAELYVLKQDAADRCITVFEEVDKLAPYLKQIDLSKLLNI